MPRVRDLEPQLPSEETAVGAMTARHGAPSPLTCPDCGGALWEVRSRVVRYQCHVGHQYAPDALDSEQRDMVDNALWTAVRVLEERAELKTRLARQAASSGMAAISDGFEDGAREAHEQAQQIRRVLFTGDADVAARPGPRRKIRRTKRRQSG